MKKYQLKKELRELKAPEIFINKTIGKIVIIYETREETYSLERVNKYNEIDKDYNRYSATTLCRDSGYHKLHYKEE